MKRETPRGIYSVDPTKLPASEAPTLPTTNKEIIRKTSELANTLGFDQLLIDIFFKDLVTIELI